VLEARHVASYAAGKAGEPPALGYENAVTLVPAAVPIRPTSRTPRPRVAGPQTAVVVGPAGEETYVDRYGRVKVQFHWDRHGVKDENSSCWIRVASSWAGKQWGAIALPRIGQEVVVGFLEGDPDQPIVIGGVYNAEQMPPYSLPENKSQSGLKTRSTKAGAPENANELRFEDKRGAEQIVLHAERDFVREVENDDLLWVGHTRTETIDHDRVATVHHDDQLTVHGSRRVDIPSGHDTTRLGAGNIEMKTDGGSVQIQAAQSLVLKVGQSTVTLRPEGIELKIGQSIVTLDGAGATVRGPTVRLDAASLTEVRGLATRINGATSLHLTGLLTKIN